SRYQQFMKIKSKLFRPRLFCAVALGIGSSFSLSAMAADSADTAPAKTSIPWSQIGAKAGADYKGDGLAVMATADGARLRCAFQRLEGEATREGLWLTSTVTNAVSDRFCVTAFSVGRTLIASSPMLEHPPNTALGFSLSARDTAGVRGNETATSPRSTDSP